MDEPTSVSIPRHRFLDRTKHLHVLNRDLNPSRGFATSIQERYELERWRNIPNQSVYNSSYSLGYIVAADVDPETNEYLLYCSENRFVRMCKIKHLRDKETIYMNFEVRSACYVKMGPCLETYMVATNDGSIKLFSIEGGLVLEHIQLTDAKLFNAIHWNVKAKQKPLLAFAAKGKNETEIMDFVTGLVSLTVSTKSGECTALSWNPRDSRIITIGTAEGVIEHYDIRKTKTVLHSSKEYKDRVITINYTEDGLYLVVLYGDRRIIVFDSLSLEKLAVAHLPPRLNGLSLQNASLHLRIHSCGHSIFVGIPCREVCYYIEINMINRDFEVKNLRSPFGGMTCCVFLPRQQHFLTFGRAQLTWQATVEDTEGIVRTVHTDNWDDDQR